jgi:GNAT superfamily N-acetyltransferase
MMESDKVNLRVFVPGDVGSVRELIDSTIEACYTGVYPGRAVEYFLQYHSESEILHRAQKGTTLVAEAGGRIVATGTLKGKYIIAVFVRHKVQGWGLGRRIMETLEERARADGVEEIWLDVSLPSRAFYEKMGYRGFEPAFLDVGDGQQLDYWKASKRLTAD